jgi:hypothetical protein
MGGKAQTTSRNKIKRSKNQELVENPEPRRFVTGHDVSHADKADQMIEALSSSCKGNALSGSTGRIAWDGFVTGHDFSRAEKANNDEGFSPCGMSSMGTAGIMR